MQRRYSALGFVSGLYQIVGVLVLGGAILFGGLQFLSTPSAYSGLVFASGLTTIVVGCLSGLGLIAVGELINLFRDMELNSRISADNSALIAENSARTVRLLEQLATRRRQQPSAPSAPSGNYPLPPQNLPPDNPRWSS